MRSNKSWTTIVEAIVAMLIIIIWTIWIYTIYSKSQKLSISVENRVKAISIAREWIEVLQNIRDTNWVLFSANSKNCWNAKDYDVNCLIDDTKKITPWNYIIYKDDNNRWRLIDKTSITWSYKDKIYRDNFKVKLDSDWLYTQSWWVDFKPIFTRKIEISYIDTDNNFLNDEKDEKMLVKAIVSWSDSSKQWNYTITIENMLTNWKED